MSRPFRVIAHRGASAHAPENTICAFEKAVEMGATEVELDVRLSADDEIMVFHDDALDRKTCRSGRVRHYDAEVLRRTDVGEWFERTHPEIEGSFAGTMIASLDEVLTALGRNVRYHIEIKGWEDWLPLRLLQTVDRFDLAAIVTITSFSMRPLVQVRSIADFVPLCFLLRDAEDALRSAEFRPELEGRDAASVHDYWIDVAAEAGFQQVGVRASDVFPRTIARATDRGLEVRGWGVRNEEDLDRLVRLGAVGATVDWPSIAIDRVRAMGFEVGGCEVAG